MNSLKAIKHLVSGLVLFCLLLVFIPNITFGALERNDVGDFGSPDGSGEVGNNADGSGTLFTNPIGVDNIYDLVYALIDTIIKIGWVVVVLALIYSGFKFVMASGKPDDITKAKKIFLYTVLGGVILLGSMGITRVVCNTAQQFNPDISCSND